MSNYDHKNKRAKYSANDNRFYTSQDMAEVKKDEATRNSMINRGEIVPKGNNVAISTCHCGAIGCFIHVDWETVPQETIQAWKREHHTATLEEIDGVKCRLYKRDWYVGAKQGEDGLWHAVIGRQTYNDRGVVKTEQILVTPLEKKLELLSQAQKDIDNTVRRWAHLRNQIYKP